jgi:hypothetical protein
MTDAPETAQSKRARPKTAQRGEAERRRAPQDLPQASVDRKGWQRALPWALTLACFTYLYFQIDRQAAREGQGALPFLIGVFREVSWTRWLALMIPYSAFFFLVDSLVVWRIVNWFNSRVSYTDILPIRGSAYIISILNEQVGKGLMAVYLNRRDGVPGWQVGSSMIFIMFCEFFYLLFWATVGVTLRWDHLPGIFHSIPVVAAGALVFFAQIFHAFRQARSWQYVGVILLRSPALLAAVVVYTLALRLFGVQAEFLDMLGYLPVIFFGAAVPGPFRAVAIALWAQLFPENPGQMAAFGLVQHNFFIFFNAAIGLLFLRRANRELFGPSRAT